MIKIDRLPTPSELTEEKKKELTNRYKQDPKKSVWNQTYIKNTLLMMSHNKCFYCETQFSDSGDLEIEHFHPKSLYQDEVVKWENLLLACSSCNRHKGNLDTGKSRIINPTVDNPRNYICLTSRYLLKGYDAEGIGKSTLQNVLGYDARWRLAEIFSGIYCRLGKELEILFNKFKGKKTSKYSRYSINNLIDKLITIFRYAQPENEYSAAIATLILTDDNFKFLWNLIKENQWEDQALNKLYLTSKNIALHYDIK